MEPGRTPVGSDQSNRGYDREHDGAGCERQKDDFMRGKAAMGIKRDLMEGGRRSFRRAGRR
jgi:hypothetical protein